MTSASRGGRRGQPWARRAALPLLLALVALLSALPGAAPAGAHANLVRSNPSAGAVLATAPAQVQLWFSEQPDPHFSDVRVVTADGKRVDKGNIHVAPGDNTSLIVDLPESLPHGAYTIVWKTVSAVDGHIVTGNVPFYIGQPPQGAALAVPTQSAPTSNAITPRPGPVADRIFALLGAITLAGGFAFWPLVMLPGLVAAESARPGPGAAISLPGVLNPPLLPSAITRRMLRVLALTWLVLAIAGMIALVQQTMAVSGESFGAIWGTPLRTELFDTRYGHTWLLRMAGTLFAGAVILLWRRGDVRGTRAALLCGCGWLAAECIFLAYSLNSHGAALKSEALLAGTADFIHLSATGLWLGGLVQFIIVVPAALRAFSRPQKLDFLRVAVPRFSHLAFVCMAIIIATGIYQSLQQLPGWSAFVDTGYGRTLLAKLIVLAPVLALAALNLLLFRPALANEAPTRWNPLVHLLSRLRPHRPERGFLVSVAAESVLGLTIVGIVGLLVNQPPARTPAVSTPGVHLAAKAEGVTVQLVIDPGSVGLNTFTATVHDHGKPPPDGTQLVLRLTYADEDRGTSEVPMQAQGRGVYIAQSGDLSAYGHWQIMALVQPPAADEVRLDFTLTVSATSATGAGTSAAAGTSVAAGRKLYLQYCARCHGESGAGDGPDGRRLDPPPANLIVHVPQHSDQQLLDWIANGIPATVMPGFKDKLSAEQQQAILNYLRTLGGGTATPTPATP
jgi:copper transport protein